MKIWVDDERPAPDGTWFHARTASDALRVLAAYRSVRDNPLTQNVRVECISLDHDLGGDDTTRPVVLWMAENNFWPDKVYVHTANVVGREWIEGMVNRYGPGVSRRT